jgi:hypothetical protein
MCCDTVHTKNYTITVTATATIVTACTVLFLVLLGQHEQYYISSTIGTACTVLLLV